MAKNAPVKAHIKEFHRKSDKVKKMLDTTGVEHTEAYLKGAEVLKGEDGQIDYELLEDVVNQDKMLDKMMDHYLAGVVKELGLSGKPKDTLDQDILLKKYRGITRESLKSDLRSTKSGYTLKAHEGQRDKLIENQQKELIPLTFDHFDRGKGHLDDIVKAIGHSGSINVDSIEEGNAAQWLDEHRQAGEIRLVSISDRYLTASGKAKKKALKSKYKG
tara:strand:+ start:1709 stop:2359 length:651 start_codon:yes stop_codon:yes gene_type:complete